MTDRTLTGTAYLQVKKDWGYTCRIIKATQNQPGVVSDGCVVVKIKLSIPDKAWKPLEIEGVVEVPETAVTQPSAEAVNG